MLNRIETLNEYQLRKNSFPKKKSELKGIGWPNIYCEILVLVVQDSPNGDLLELQISFSP